MHLQKFFRCAFLGTLTTRRKSNGCRCIALLAIFALLCVASTKNAHSQDWKSGQDSPVHDSDRLYPLSAQQIVLENEHLYLAFDQHTGALVKFVSKVTGWQWQTAPEFGESFRLFVPTPDRSYNPVLGSRNTLTSFEKSADGKSLHLVWSNLQSEYQGKLDITLRGRVHLEGDTVGFDMTVENHSAHTISSVSWPILGGLARPKQSPPMRLATLVYAGLNISPLYDPSFPNQGYFGTNYPTHMVNQYDSRFILVSTPDQGLYIGAHNPDAQEMVKYLFELKPGYDDSWDNSIPKDPSISGHPVRLSMEVVHFAFLNAGESGALAPIVLGPYTGDWHSGVDIYKRWLATWYKPLPLPEWAADVHSWQQLQINSAEDDLRTPYRDLPRRAQQAAANGITALQLVGWNNGGQDRGNPSQDTDPRLGSAADLKDAIAQIEKMGIHVILFNKYPWADTTTDWYKTELYKYMATDPYGNVYPGGGYRYETPEQLAGLNVRGFAVACTNDVRWREVSAREFQKVIDLGGDGMLYDEVAHHHGAELCFSSDHGHHSPATLWSGDILLGNMFRKMVRDSVGENHFLFSGEDPEDTIGEIYSLSYFRISPGHIPEERYAFPFRPMMIAITGFDDREEINRALMYRYILSYEPFNFKGNIDDFPLTVAYGKKVDALRTRYKDYLWDAEFRDTQEARVTIAGKPYPDYSVFRRDNGEHAVVITNTKTTGSLTAAVAFDHPWGNQLICASPEKPDGVSCSHTVSVPPRSVLVVMEQ